MASPSAITSSSSSSSRDGPANAASSFAVSASSENNEEDAARTTVIVMSDSGKPIFCSSDASSDSNNNNVARICGLLQAVRTSLLHNRDLRLGSSFGGSDIRSLESAARQMVFMTVGSITLVAVTKKNNTITATTTEAYLRLQLEYAYAQIIFTLTDQVQAMFAQNASLDLQSLLSTNSSNSNSNNNSPLRTILRQMQDDPAPFMTAAVPALFPLSAAVRHETSVVLKDVGDQTPNTVFALLLFVNRSSQPQLVTLVQPSFRPHQLRAADLHLILGFLQQRPDVAFWNGESELWLPLCLPRFHSSGFLTCFTHCLMKNGNDSSSPGGGGGLVLALVSQDGSTEQFQLFRAATAQIRRRLGIPHRSGSVLRISDAEQTPAKGSAAAASSSNEEKGNDVQWSRQSQRDEEEVEGTSSKLDDDEDYEIIPHQVGASGPCLLLEELTALMKDDAVLVKSKLEEYLDLGLEHFVFRMDVPIIRDRSDDGKRTTPNKKNGKKQHHPPGFLTQCISPPLKSKSTKALDGNDAESKRNVWSVYQRLNLRLRLGSANNESVADAFAAITKEFSDESAGVPSVAKHSPAMLLAESPPKIQGVTYLCKDGKTYLGMNGQGFELYVVLRK